MKFPAWVGPRLARRLQQIQKRPDLRFDWLGFATGPEGYGKTTVLAQIATILDPSFTKDPLARFAYTGQEFMRLGDELQPGQMRILDEGDQGAYSLDFQTAENKELSKHLFRCRELRLLSGMAIPHIRWMAPVIKEHRATDWILMRARGRALWHEARRADYDRVKPSWNQLFEVPNVPPIKEPWWMEYVDAKIERLHRAARPNVEAPPPLRDLAPSDFAARLRAGAAKT